MCALSPAEVTLLNLSLKTPFSRTSATSVPCFVLGNADFKEKVWHDCMFVPENADFKEKVWLDCMFVLGNAGFKEKVWF